MLNFYFFIAQQRGIQGAISTPLFTISPFLKIVPPEDGIETAAQAGR